MRSVEEILINNELVKHVISNYDDNLIKTEPTIVKTSVNTDDFIRTIINNLPNSDILPNNCRFIEKLGNGNTLMVIEQQPKVRTITVDRDMTYEIERHKINGKFEEFNLDKISLERPYKFTLSFPFIVYVIVTTNYNEFRSMKLFFRINPLTSLDDYLLQPCLPNINTSHDVCLGYEHRDSDFNISELVTDVIDNFWFNKFNTDYNLFPKFYEDVPELCDFFTWQHYSKIDPLFIFSAKWKDAGYSLKNIIRKYEANSTSASTEGNYIYQLKSIMEGRCGKQTQYNLSESIILDDLIISIGDEVTYRGETHYIYYFDQDNKIIKLEDPNGNLIDVSFKKGLDEEIKKSLDRVSCFDTIDIGNGMSLSEGDIVYFKNLGSIATIEKILKLKDETIQIKIGKDFYLLNNFLNRKIEKLDPNNIEFDGVKLVKNETYYILDRDYSYAIYHSITLGKYEGVRTIKGIVYLMFKTQSGNMSNIPLTRHNLRYKILSEQQIISEPIFRINDELVTNNTRNHMCIVKNFGIGVDTREQFYSYNIRNYLTSNIQFARDYFSNICRNETSFTIKSYDKDISYSIGDEVITIDWDMPHGMFNIKKIVGFLINENDFCFQLTDDQNNTIVFPIVHFDEVNSIIKNHFATVRKVCREFGGFKVGEKIKAKVRSIADFPMKDCNQIKAFVIDDIRPLVLLSNYRTLLIEDLESLFDIYSPLNMKYHKMDVIEASVPIKVQDGDIFKSTNYRNVNTIGAIGQRYYVFLTPSNSNCFAARKANYANSTSLKRYGLLSPRYSTAQLNEMMTKHGVLNEYGNVMVSLDIGSLQAYKTNWSIIS